MTTLALVDVQEGLAPARAKWGGHALVTDNPMLAFAEGPLENIDAAMDQALSLALGRQALLVADGMDRILRDPRIGERYRVPLEWLRLAGHTSRLMSTLVYRAAVMARALAVRNPGRVGLAIADLPRWDAAMPLLPTRFGSPYRALAEDGFFGGVPVEVLALPWRAPGNLNDTQARDNWRRYALLPLPVVVEEGLTRLLPRRPSGAAVIMNGDNEAMREALPWLRLRGVPTRRAGKLMLAGRIEPPAPGTNPQPDPVVSAVVEAWLAEQFAAMGVFTDEQVRALVCNTLLHVSAGLEHLSLQVAPVNEMLDRWFSAPGPRLLATNGLFGPTGALVYGACRQRAVRVVDFEHGVTTGLAALSAAKIGYSEASVCDVLAVCCAQSAKGFTEASPAGGGPRIEVIGLPDHVRAVLHRPLQRFLARRRAGMRSGETLVMHVSTFPYAGNLRSGLGSPTESTIFDIDRRLLTEVYPNIPHRVLFKQYPAQRLAFEPPYETLIASAANVRFGKDEDFRYIRAAADVIVTSTPTSTLGWCIGTGRPLVWLDSARVNPLVDDGLRRAFADSFLTVDMDGDDWVERLRALLDRPYEDLKREFDAKATARRALVERAIAGPPGNVGRRAAAIIAKAWRNQS